ncbi:hypothetical protein CP_0250 [Chlamydia pneumoniae AR39]|uniref:Uncharacterized protein n=1 Tax=Chlamydia pneumoniae TaxID=83558 RepID=Q9K2B3_CHLPN|nr:hypothetical protein CP_0250 [Chlamydia pneumoniae AR39]
MELFSVYKEVSHPLMRMGIEKLKLKILITYRRYQ